jgi:hypothetical protein
MKRGDLVMIKRSKDDVERTAALVLENGDMIAIEEGTHAIVLNVDIDPLDPYMNEVRVLINGMVGVLWPHELEELDETR